MRTMFEGKKFVSIITSDITPKNLAFTAAMIGLQFGRHQPQMVGRNQTIQGRTHLGITTENLPVLNGLDSKKMRSIREALKQEPSLMVVDVTDAVATAASYKEYAQVLSEKPVDQINYWGIGIFGDAELISKITQGLKLYDKPKAAPVKSTGPGLIGEGDLPTMTMVLSNNIPGGRLANAAAILGVTFGKEFGDSLFGPDITDSNGCVHTGLPMIGISILNGSADSGNTLKALRESLHADPTLPVVDVTDATKSTKSYEQYLEVAEALDVAHTTYWGVGMCASEAKTNPYIQGLSPFMTAGEEQAAQKAQAAASKWNAKSKAPASKQGGQPSTEGLYASQAHNKAVTEQPAPGDNEPRQFI